METNHIIRNGELIVVMLAVIIALLGGIAQGQRAGDRTMITTAAH